MSRIGDWNCRSCQHLNFQRRDTCQRCGDPKLFGDFPSGFNAGRPPAGASFCYPGSDVRPGDWYCAVGNCGTHNFANRSTCFKCGTFKDDPSAFCRFDSSRTYAGVGSGRSCWKSGDWICTRIGCNEHNFASRMECFRCSAPRDSANRMY
ncbi:hypothetical protein MLD38_007973 [Melastoma candidum]|uniref:Uncharacterized protein n=1 Tax=Melastoma candidum TaxID=119954 RepID=A0ACB9RSG0_9MYRT|nr:hypothetical protein MLD38_007973 [Melastoma candidum]